MKSVWNGSVTASAAFSCEKKNHHRVTPKERRQKASIKKESAWRALIYKTGDGGLAQISNVCSTKSNLLTMALHAPVTGAFCLEKTYLRAFSLLRINGLAQRMRNRVTLNGVFSAALTDCRAAPRALRASMMISGDRDACAHSAYFAASPRRPRLLLTRMRIRGEEICASSFHTCTAPPLRLTTHARATPARIPRAHAFRRVRTTLYGLRRSCCSRRICYGVKNGMVKGWRPAFPVYNDNSSGGGMAGIRWRMASISDLACLRGQEKIISRRGDQEIGSCSLAGRTFLAAAQRRITALRVAAVYRCRTYIFHALSAVDAAVLHTWRYRAAQNTMLLPPLSAIKRLDGTAWT